MPYFSKYWHKKKVLNKGVCFGFLGRGNTMLDSKDWSLNGQRFGKLELVDREIFFISFNRRDN